MQSETRSDFAAPSLELGEDHEPEDETAGQQEQLTRTTFQPLLAAQSSKTCQSRLATIRSTKGRPNHRANPKATRAPSVAPVQVTTLPQSAP